MIGHLVTAIELSSSDDYRRVLFASLPFIGSPEAGVSWLCYEGGPVAPSQVMNETGTLFLIGLCGCSSL